MHTLIHTLGLDKFAQAALTKLMGSLAASETHGYSHGQGVGTARMLFRIRQQFRASN